MPFHVNDGGTWKTPEVWLNDGGTWKRPEVWVNDAGTWKLVASPVSVSISPSFRDAATANSSYTFPSCVVTVTGGTATSYSWGFLFPSGGTWSVASGQGLSSATARVTGVFESAYAEFYCDVTVGGQVFRVSVPHSYLRAF